MVGRQKKQAFLGVRWLSTMAALRMMRQCTTYSAVPQDRTGRGARRPSAPFPFAPRRPGDIAECWCDPSKAKRELGWEAQYGIEEMCADSWNWQQKNPNGYNDPE